jgi:hypothetical protein
MTARINHEFAGHFNNLAALPAHGAWGWQRGDPSTLLRPSAGPALTAASKRLGNGPDHAYHKHAYYIHEGPT